MKENIISKAKELFIQFGFKRVTMDDIAREMAISKKTIYQFFKDKNEIVCSATEQYLKKECCKIQLLEDQSENVVEHLVNTSKQLRSHIGTVDRGALQDLKRYFPDGWKIFLHYKREVFLRSIVKILEKGVQEGYFRPDINPQILGVMRMEQIQLAFDENLYPREQFEFTEVHLQLLNNFINGILTEKGQQLYKDYSKSLDTDETNN